MLLSPLSCDSWFSCNCWLLLATTSLSPEQTATAQRGLTILVWLAGVAIVLAALALVYAVATRRLTDASAITNADASRLRKLYLIWLAAYLGLAIYGSLIPLELRHVDWATAVEQFRNIPYLQIGQASRADWVANILLFIPLAYLATAVLTLGVRSWLVRMAAAIVVSCCCATLSVAIEFTQIWFWPRTVSLNDIIAESIGGVIGSMLWLLLGVTIHGWLAAYFAPQRRRTQIDRLLEFYLVGLVIYSILPLDLTISPAELYHKFSHGKVIWIPFAEFRWDFQQAYSLFTDIVTFIPVGMYCATALTSEDRPVRSLLASTLLGVGFAAVIEIAQLFVIEHFTSITTLLVAAVGSCLGAGLMRRYRIAGLEDAWTRWPQETVRYAAGICLALMGVYAVVLVAIFCSGGAWESDPARLWQRFHGFWRPPFAALYRGREYNALSDLLRKILFFLPLGILGAVASWTSPTPERYRRWLIAAVLFYAATVCFSIEMLQVHLPPPPGVLDGPAHVADAGDVMVCTAGAALGLFLTWRVLTSSADAPS